MAVGALNVNQGVRKTVVLVSVACAGLLSACGSAPQQTASKAELGQLAKRDFLTQQELAAVRVGMSESDVRGLIGPAMLRDASDKSKWVYVLKQGQGPSEEFLKWGVFFKQGKVDRLAALEDLPSLELPPSVAEAAATKALLPAEPMSNSKPMLSLGPVPTAVPEPVSAPAASLPEAVAVSLAAAPVASELPSTPPAQSAEAVAAPFDALDAAGQASELLSQWAAAWSAKDAKQYLSFYATTFEHGQASRKAWEAQRRARLGDRAQIRVKLSDMAVDVQSEQLARVRFKQEYSSDRYRDVGNKVVTLVRVGAGWKIQKEEFAK